MEQLIASLPALVLRQWQRLQNRHDVLFHRHFAENRFLLRQISHAEPRPLVHRIIRDIVSAKNNAPAVWPNQSDNHVKAGCLAGAVRPEQTDNLAFARADVNPIDDRPAAVNFYELLSGKDIVDLGRGRGSKSRIRSRGSLADHGLGEGWGLVSALVSSFGCWR